MKLLKEKEKKQEITAVIENDFRKDADDVRTESFIRIFIVIVANKTYRFRNLLFIINFKLCIAF